MLTLLLALHPDCSQWLSFAVVCFHWLKKTVPFKAGKTARAECLPDLFEHLGFVPSSGLQHFQSQMVGWMEQDDTPPKGLTCCLGSCLGGGPAHPA